MFEEYIPHYERLCSYACTRKVGEARSVIRNSNKQSHMDVSEAHKLFSIGVNCVFHTHSSSNGVHDMACIGRC